MLETKPRSIPIALPFLGKEELEAVRQPIETGWLTQGPKVAEFEHNFAKRHQVDCALATTSCTTALHLGLTALGVGERDEVIVPAFTWVATANVVRYCGARPVFVDVDPLTYNIDAELVRSAIGERTKAVIAVHLFGQCANMDSLKDAAGDLPIIEDAACAAGASYRGVPAGALGAFGCFSFHPRKSITTGEGGMITTSDPHIAENAEILRNHGASISEEVRHQGPKPYLLPEFNMLGFNYRMTDLQGAVGVEQLKRLDSFLAERRRWADWYTQQLSQVDWLQTPVVLPNVEPGWQAYVCKVDESLSPQCRNELMDRLQELGVSTRPGTHSVPLLGAYRGSNYGEPGQFPVAESCDRLTLAIPLHNRMAEEDYEYVVESILSIK
jgi:perosamine synthetase